MQITVWGPKEPKPAYKPGFRHVFTGLFLGILGYPILPIMLLLIFNADTDQEALTAFYQSNAGTIASLVALWLGLLTGVAFAARLMKPEGFKKLTDWGFSKWDPVIGIVFTAIFLGLNYGVSLLVEQFSGGKGGQDLGNTQTATSVTGGWQVLMILGVCIGAPVVEEIFFRGLLLKVSIEKFKPFIGVILTSFIFGCMHIQASLASSIYTVSMTALVGLGLALVRLKTKRLGSSIWSHMIFNTVNMVIAYSVIAS